MDPVIGEGQLNAYYVNSALVPAIKNIPEALITRR